ncbi:MAG: ABC transporter ATP-binding protein, partial [Nitrospirae bacterium]
VIEIEDLWFSYPERPDVLSGLQLRVFAGQRVGIMGPNGAGKSTLFLVLLGFLRPQKGTIRLFGRPCQKEEDFQGFRGRVGLLFQDSDDQLFCPTVEEDLAFGPLNLGFSRQEVEEVITETLQRLGISHLRHRHTHKLSGGEKRLVALASVLSMRPEVLLLDEPVTGLAPEPRERIKEYLLSSGHTYLVISHEEDFLREVSESIYILKEGRLEPA